MNDQPWTKLSDLNRSKWSSTPLGTFPKIAIDGNYLRVVSGTCGEVSHFFIEPPEEGD